ncbi:MAG TPA: AAA domain-containing protein, partial [Candidatus Cloacimonadota bacterium]|nr:AAA domain-containing protein [Candidatus Cloacimonadota bacterium]
MKPSSQEQIKKRTALSKTKHSLSLETGRQIHGRLEELISSPQDAKTKLILLRQVLERLYKQLCSQESRAFSGLFPRMQFIHEENQVPRELSYQANHLRIICNKAAHDDMESGFDAAFSSGILVIITLLEFFGELAPSDLISRFLLDKAVKPYQKLPDSPKESFNACLQDRTVRDFEIELLVLNEQGELCNIYLKDDQKSRSEGRCWSYLDKMVWPYCNLAFLELSRSKNNPLVFYSNPLTQVVLEPDFLLDATSVAECIQDESCQPQFFIMNKLISEPVNEKLMLGNLVNQLFDHLVFNPKAEYEDFAGTLRQSQPIAFCSLGEEAVQRINDTIYNQHFPQLKSFAESMGDQDLQVEPSFICPKYGLQGRLDLLYGDGEKLAIVELKSGKYPARDTWRSQQMQVTAYNMIIRSIFGGSVRSSSSILYSAASEQFLRNVENHILREQELLFCRNRIIGILHQLAQDPAPFFTWLKNSRVDYKNPIFKEKSRQVQEILCSIDDLEFEWFLQQVKAVIGEIWTVKTGSADPENLHGKGYSSLWQDDPVTKLDSFQIITGLKIKSRDLTTVVLSLPQEISSDFREGDVVVLYNMNRPVEKQQLLRGNLREINDKELVISIRGGLKGDMLMTGEDSWAIEHDILDSLLYVPLSSLFTFLGAPRDKRECLLGLRPPRGSIVQYGTSQQDICRQMQNAEDYCVIQGPPGTGKTSGLLMSYIRQVFDESSRRLLILSYTNRAVDEICRNLEENGLP